MIRVGDRALQPSDIAAYIDQYDPDIVLHASAENPDVGTVRGHEALAGLTTTWRETFEELRLEPSEFIDAGDYVIIAVRVRGRGADSGAEIDMPRTWSAKYRDGKAIEVWEHRTKEQALEAVGLSE